MQHMPWAPHYWARLSLVLLTTHSRILFHCQCLSNQYCVKYSQYLTISTRRFCCHAAYTQPTEYCHFFSSQCFQHLALEQQLGFIFVNLDNWQRLPLGMYNVLRYHYLHSVLSDQQYLPSIHRPGTLIIIFVPDAAKTQACQLEQVW